LNRNENQDIAVFTVQKFSNGSAQIQLIGDEALYGRNYIVEPIYAETSNPGYQGRTVYRDNVNVVTTTYYEVAAWPVIRFMYNPYYICWHHGTGVTTLPSGTPGGHSTGTTTTDIITTGTPITTHTTIILTTTGTDTTTTTIIIACVSTHPKYHTG
jgi:hypothetical protein